MHLPNHDLAEAQKVLAITVRDLFNAGIVPALKTEQK